MQETGRRMELVEELRGVLGGRVTVNETMLEQHSSDESYHSPHLPDVVVFPDNAEEVSDIMKLAARFDVPVVPYGYGSSLEGSVIPYQAALRLILPT